MIRRADPALYQFDQVLAILAAQNKHAGRPGDRVGRGARAGGARRASRSATSSTRRARPRRRPPRAATRWSRTSPSSRRSCSSCDPTMQRLGEFAAAGTPVMTDLRAAAPSINTLFEQLGPFCQAALPTFRTLGNLADTGRAGAAGRRAGHQRHPRVRAGGEAVRGRAGAGADETPGAERHPAAAGRDPVDGGDVERLRLVRALPAHVPDGAGPHACRTRSTQRAAAVPATFNQNGKRVGCRVDDARRRRPRAAARSSDGADWRRSLQAAAGRDQPTPRGTADGDAARRRAAACSTICSAGATG